METFVDNIEHFNPNNPYAGDEKTPVQFYMGVMKDDVATEEKGHPIFKDVEMIKIFGGRNNIVDRPVCDQDMHRFARGYQHWKMTGAAESNPASTGLPLEHWPAVTRAQAEELKFFKVFTVEHLAAMPDSEGQKIMGFSKLKVAAEAHLEMARGEAPLIKTKEELKAALLQIDNLNDQIAKMSKRLEKLEK